MDNNNASNIYDGIDPKHVQVFDAPGFVDPEAREELFLRHAEIPGHDQGALEDKHVVMVGCGGIGSGMGMGLVRSGVRRLTIVEPDFVEPSNLARQVLYGEKDIGQPKAFQAGAALVGHAVAGARITCISLGVEDVPDKLLASADVITCGVDNNWARQNVCVRGQRLEKPVVFTMLSRDGMRCHCFLQEKLEDDPCLWCALPNMDPEEGMPCAAAIVTSCFLAGTLTLFFVHRALLGWPAGVTPFNWRQFDLMDIDQSTTGRVLKRTDCTMCGIPA